MSIGDPWSEVQTRGLLIMIMPVNHHTVIFGNLIYCFYDFESLTLRKKEDLYLFVAFLTTPSVLRLYSIE
jgi:hypothetical protein